jgi:hypothetical protein
LNRETALKMLSELLEAKDLYVRRPALLLFVRVSANWTKHSVGRQKACQERDASLAWVKVAPESDALRSDTRLADLLRRMNFPDG